MIHFRLSDGHLLAVLPRSIIAARTSESGSTEIHLTSGSVFYVREPLGDVLDRLPSRARHSSEKRYRELVDG